MGCVYDRTLVITRDHVVNLFFFIFKIFYIIILLSVGKNRREFSRFRLKAVTGFDFSGHPMCCRRAPSCGP